MNQVLCLLQAARATPDPRASLGSVQMLSELLALHEEMIMQLNLERLSVAGTADFLTSLINQHEKAAAMLRARLENQEADGANGSLKAPGRERTDQN